VLAGGGQAGGQGTPVRRALRPDHQPAVLQPAQHHVCRLPGDERAPGKFGAGQARALVEQLEAGVPRHGEAVAAAAFYETQLGLRSAPVPGWRCG
jgi:hypothetical protein